MCDFDSVADGFGNFFEHLCHLLPAAEIELVRTERQAVRIGKFFAGVDANKNFVGSGIVLADVVNIVCGDQAQAFFLRKIDQMFVDCFLFGQAMVLQFEEKPFVAEHGSEFICNLDSAVQVIAYDGVGDFTGQARAGADQSFAELPEDFLVDSRPIVEAFQVGDAGEFEEIFIALKILGQQQQVIRCFADALSAFFAAVFGGNVGLVTDDRFDACSHGRGVKFYSAVHVAVIGDGEGVHAVLLALVEQVVEAAGAVEQGIMRVHVQMNELRTLGHNFPVIYPKNDIASFKKRERKIPRNNHK